ncbi:MAG: hypothetical protein BroJett018_29440 [Chloroflexota bacterium]|nr:MAG: hypothetical protein BroJett018_29440 [Chloroflexota bacterium]
MATLNETVKEVLAWYASGGFDLASYLLSNEAEGVYAVNMINTSKPRHPLTSKVIVLVRIVGDCVVVEEDRTDRPVEERLMAAGIPREKIVLAYANEALPQTM